LLVLFFAGKKDRIKCKNEGENQTISTYSKYEANISSSHRNIVYNRHGGQTSRGKEKKEEKKRKDGGWKDFFVRFTPTKAATC
jgi:hypothetical protein